MSTIYTVYMIVSPSDKKYIGISKNIRIRFNQHNRSKKTYAINAAFKKYGKDNMKIEILEMSLTYEEALIREKFWIEKLNTIVPNGYNLTTGGEAGKIHSEITKQKISQSRIGKIMTEETKAKIAKTLSGRTFTEDHRNKLSLASKGIKKSPQHCLNTSKGKKGQIHSEETKRKMSLTRKGKKWSEKRRQAQILKENRSAVS